MPTSVMEVTGSSPYTDLNATPFLKWAGGKSSLLPQLVPLFPQEFRQYHEPFLGGAAVFFHLKPSGAVLSDINPRLVDCYLAIRDHVQDVISLLAELRNTHGKEQYYQAREDLNCKTDLSIVERAALQIYLNKTCYNGLYRENRRGHFNVPIGRYQNPSIFSVGNLFAASTMLQRADITNASFDQILEKASAGDFVYFDPPYEPISKTSNFVSFTRHGFTSEDQARLAKTCRQLDRMGCSFIVSNSNAPLIRELYRGFSQHQIQARRRINSKATRRGPVVELVIRNYSRTRRPGVQPLIRE